MSPTESRVKPHKPHAPFMHSISDQLIPKDVLPGKLYADLHRWWFPETAEDVEQAKLAIMGQMPLKRDEIYKAQFLVPDGTVCFIPDMRFGWVWGNEEVEARGKEAGKCVIVDALRIQSLLSDSDIEEESDVEGRHCAPYSKIMKHWPICTAEVLLEQAVAELGLDKKYPWHRTFFEIRGINQCFDERDKATQFISIYTNKDLAPGVGYAIPSDEDIRRVQDWLGLKDREPGWWLSGTHYMPEPPYRSRRAK